MTRFALALLLSLGCGAPPKEPSIGEEATSVQLIIEPAAADAH